LKEESAFPGDPNAWREQFLAQGRAERGPGTALDVIDAPVRPTELTSGAQPRVAPTLAAQEEVRPKTSDLVRMQGELQQAMAKPMEERKWIMVIDLQKCIGCSACTIACKAENRLPPGVVYRPVIEEEVGEYPNVTRQWLPRPCMQCDDPPCVPVCPVNATWKREDGIVVIDYDRCIGCRYCLTACPYGARYSDFGEDYSDGTPEKQPYEEMASPEYGKEWTREGDGSPIGNARKCQFCIHRLDAGMLPACVTTCIGGATYFGDKEDPDTLVNELIFGRRGSMRLKEELGTEPKVYYLT
jgi:molybdopterin-containing oxidoreductase family iron-sulfur binding subunit